MFQGLDVISLEQRDKLDFAEFTECRHVTPHTISFCSRRVSIKTSYRQPELGVSRGIKISWFIPITNLPFCRDATLNEALCHIVQ